MLSSPCAAARRHPWAQEEGPPLQGEACLTARGSRGAELATARFRSPLPRPETNSTQFSFNVHNHPKKLLLLSPFHRGANLGLARLQKVFKVS